MTKESDNNYPSRKETPTGGADAKELLEKLKRNKGSRIESADLVAEMKSILTERQKQSTDTSGEPETALPQTGLRLPNELLLSSIEQEEIHSTEVGEILGYIPNWIIRWGITVIVAVAAIILAGSWFVKYPDVISAPIDIYSTNPTVFLKARTGGALKHLLVADSQLVIAGQYLGVVENAADYRLVQTVLVELEAVGELFAGEARPAPEALDLGHYSPLGELQADYDAFFNSVRELRQFFDLKYYQSKLASIRTQHQGVRRHHEQLKIQLLILEERFALSVQQHERTRELHENGMISQTDYENARASLLSEQYSLEGARLSVTSSELQLSQLEQNLSETRNDSVQTVNRLWNSVEQARNRLLSQIRMWEQRYVLAAPIDGVVSLSRYWNEGQNVNAGAIVMAVIPGAPADIIGRIELPVSGSGKVRAGQKVNVKFASYPDTEYGIVRGVVLSKSLVSTEEAYIVEVGFPNQLLTNYGIQLQFAPRMLGSAEIITDDLRLFQRLVNLSRSKVSASL